MATQNYPHISKSVESNQRCNILFIYKSEHWYFLLHGIQENENCLLDPSHYSTKDCRSGLPTPKVEHKNGHFASGWNRFLQCSQLKTALTFVLSLPLLLCFTCPVLPLTLLPGNCIKMCAKPTTAFVFQLFSPSLNSSSRSEMVDSLNEHNEQACSGHMIQCRNREERNVSLYTCTPQGQ